MIQSGRVQVCVGVFVCVCVSVGCCAVEMLECLSYIQWSRIGGGLVWEGGGNLGGKGVIQLGE